MNAAAARGCCWNSGDRVCGCYTPERAKGTAVSQRTVHLKLEQLPAEKDVWQSSTGPADRRRKCWSRSAHHALEPSASHFITHPWRQRHLHSKRVKQQDGCFPAGQLPVPDKVNLKRPLEQGPLLCISYRTATFRTVNLNNVFPRISLRN